MKKLRLSMDALQVETFETLTLPPSVSGTVQGRQRVVNAVYGDEGTDASNCATCDTCQGPNCCNCNQSTVA